MESNQLISPKHIEQFALPAHVEYIAGLNTLGITRYFFHICGDQERNLQFLSEISSWPHPAVISIGHEVDLREAARSFPNDIIYGNIDPRIIQSGSPQEVYNESRKTIEIGKTIRGGFILAPGCDLPVTASRENVFAMARAVKDAGIY
jgi:uroporphyrinogen decarboxylase